MQRRPWLCGSAALLVLVVLALPLFSMRLAFTDAGNDPPGYTTRDAYDLLAAVSARASTARWSSPPTSRPARGRPAAAAVQALDARLAGVPGVASVAPAVFNPAGNAAVIVAYPTTPRRPPRPPRWSATCAVP